MNSLNAKLGYLQYITAFVMMFYRCLLNKIFATVFLFDYDQVYANSKDQALLTDF